MRFNRKSNHSHRGRQRPHDVLATFPLSFGRYCGKPLAVIPRSYLNWVLKADGVPDADVWAVKRFLAAAT